MKYPFATMTLPLDIAWDLEELCGLLSQLPPINQSTGFVYPFEGFLIDEEWHELTGSVQGSVNHSLEVAFEVVLILTTLLSNSRVMAPIMLLSLMSYLWTCIHELKL
jgi:hypothetical protein